MIKIDYKKILYYIIIIDLLLSGVGRLIVVGPVTGRLVLFVFATISWIVPSLANGFRFEKKSFLLIAVFLYYLLVNVLIVGEAPISVKMDFFLRYAFIMMTFYFENYFRGRNVHKEVANAKVLFKKLTLIFSVFSILLWAFAFVSGISAYTLIEVGFFRRFTYGQLAYIGGRIPRIFMKTSVFVPVGLFFYIDEYIDFKKKKDLIAIFLHIAALVTTFTSGFWLFSLLCTIVILIKKRAFELKGIVRYVLVFLVMGIIASKLKLLDIIASKYNGEYTSDNRLVQLLGLLKVFIERPVFGHGFGTEVAIKYNHTLRVTAGFEISYCELLVDVGIVGTILFFMCISLVLIRLFRQSRKTPDTFLWAMGLIFICLQSLTNPYINNSIGLTYFALCAGIANNLMKEEKNYSFNKLLLFLEKKRAFIKLKG